MATLKTRPLRPTSKGQITLPISIRRQLNLDANTLLTVRVEDEKIVLEPLRLDEPSARLYSTPEIDEFLAQDKLSPEDAAFFKKLLRQED